MPIITRIAILSSNCRTINSIPARSLKIFYPPSIDNVFLAISIRNRRLSAPQRTRKSYITILQVCISFPPPWPVSFIHSPPSPSFRYRLQSTAFFPISFFPPPPFPDISYRAVSWKGRFYIFLVDSLPRIIWLDAILNCAFPIILSRLWYSMRNACSLLSPPPPPIRGSRTIIDGNFWRIEIEVLHFLTSKNLFEFIPI